MLFCTKDPCWDGKWQPRMAVQARIHRDPQRVLGAQTLGDAVVAAVLDLNLAEFSRFSILKMVT